MILNSCFCSPGEGNSSPLRWSPPSSAALVAAALAPPALRPWLPDPPSKKTNHLGKTGWHPTFNLIFMKIRFVLLYFTLITGKNKIKTIRLSHN